MIRSLRELIAFWREILWKSGPNHRVIVWQGRENPSYREFRPQRLHLRTAFITAFLLYTLGIGALTLLSMSRGLVPQYDFQELHQRSMLTSLRLQEIEDSLDIQIQYLANLQQLLSRDYDSALTTPPLLIDTVSTSVPEPNGVSPTSLSARERGDQYPAIPWPKILSADAPADGSTPHLISYLASLQLPVLPPVDGFITRGFNASEGHYAVDIATSEGSMVRSIGDGYIIFSDWTYEGGYTIACQHADGYVSIYKHNQRLLKRVGDRVRARESIAVSGDSGEFTSGPHLHFELWNNGLAQDPSTYLLGY